MPSAKRSNSRSETSSVLRVAESWELWVIGCTYASAEVCNHPDNLRGGCGRKQCPRLSRPAAKPRPKWRGSLEAYFEEAREGLAAVLNDESWISLMQRRYPGVDVRATIEVSHAQYWGTGLGWENKKRRRGANIDWKRTYEYPLGQPRLSVKLGRTLSENL